MNSTAHQSSPESPDDPIIQLLGREDCDLCDAVEAELASYRQACKVAFEVEWIDVDSNPDLKHRFGDKVPVLMLGGAELCHYFFDPEAVESALQSWQTNHAPGSGGAGGRE